MFKSLLFLLLLFPLGLMAQQPTAVDRNHSQHYVSLKDNKVYDIEIIVFAYKHPLPNNKTYTNKAIIDDTLAVELKQKSRELPFSRTLEVDKLNSEIESADQKPGYTVSLDEKESSQQALTWFNHNQADFKMTKIWNKLKSQPNIVPLVHRSWRQTETSFQQPTYVKMTNISNNESLTNDSLFLADYSLSGMVALSQGRYMHFENSLNLYRTVQDQYGDIVKNMVFSLDEKKQVKVDELNYFDSPWIGSIVKITKYEESTNEQQ